MLGLFLIYYIGKTFYTLAGEYNKNEWAFGILGVIIYYVGTFAFGLCYALYFSYQNPYFIDNMDDFVLGLISIPAGLLFCWGMYHILKKKWEKEAINDNNSMSDYNILDDEFLK